MRITATVDKSTHNFWWRSPTDERGAGPPNPAHRPPHQNPGQGWGTHELGAHALGMAPRGEAADRGRAPIARTRQLTPQAVIGDQITMAKHRAPRYVRTKHALAGVPVAAGATVVGLSVLSTPAASAATTHDWTGVAQCESGGDWDINTGNGYYGGLQFSQPTWSGYGGTTLAARADLATPAEQVQIAEKVLAGQGIGAWPTCGRFLTDGTTAAAAQAAAPAAAAPATAAAPTQAATQASAPATTQDTGSTVWRHGRHAAPAGDYTVRRGDTVATIAAAHGQSWRELYQRNVDVIGGDPDVLVPGQVLATSGAGSTTTAVAAPAVVTTVAVAAPAATTSAAVTSTATAHITNSAGAVQPQAQAAADAVVSNVPGAAGITLGGTRASAVDPAGHPSGLAVDYMVLSDADLGDAIVAYHLAHWDELGVDYIIWQQKILTSPTGSWKQMEDRGSATANHMDHVHVNYQG
jgi:LysM repeat protein